MNITMFIYVTAFELLLLVEFFSGGTYQHDYAVLNTVNIPQLVRWTLLEEAMKIRR
jgi:hypothetical protein